MTKTTARGLARAALQQDTRSRSAVVKAAGGKGTQLVSGVTQDSFVNFAHRIGMGADNALTAGTYGFNPITRNRILLEWIHRGSWLGGVAIDITAQDMTRKGVEFHDQMDPGDVQKIEARMGALGFWEKTSETIQWSRLYGGSIGVHLIDGQDLRTPLKPDTPIARGSYKGILPLDRWQVDPSLEDLVTEYGPHLGLPKYYRVNDGAPALRGAAVHYSRVAYRLEGVKLPYQQRLTENLWGISVLERLYDRMVAFDSASMGAAQLVFKSYLRTLKVKELRNIIAAGGPPLNGLMSYTEMMRRFQGQEGITLLDMDDEFDVQQSSAFSGVEKVIDKLAEQVAGALQMPVCRLFGQSPGGLNSSGDSEMRTYNEGINQKQEQDLRDGVSTGYRLCAQSEGIAVPEDFDFQFRSLQDLDEVQKSTVAKTTVDAVSAAQDAGLIGRQTGLRELRQSSRRTGIFTNITTEMVEAADDEVLPPTGELEMAQAHEEQMADKTHELGQEAADAGHTRALEMQKAKEKEDARPNGKTKAVGDKPRRRAAV